MELFWATVGLFLLSSGLQAGLIFLQQSGGWLTRWWGTHAFAIYNVITLIPWAAFVLVYVVFQFTEHPALPWEGIWLQIIGGILIFAGLSEALWVAILLGPARLNGLRFFSPSLQKERVISGPFRWLENPMYTGYFLVFLGIALLRNSLYDVVIALESLLLLNYFQSTIENRGLCARTQQSLNQRGPQ
jgi:protein-S-isoprenylcysteine O-methyltransferase Ste14